jgi:glyoxylase-like metal-dependent hydrolase (beta-lactamase superfamily II)
MYRTARLMTFGAVALSLCVRLEGQQQVVGDAATAMGGGDRLLAAKTLVIEGAGMNGNLGQDMTPEATGQQFTVAGYKRSVDLANSRARVEQTRTPTFVYFQGPAPQKQVLGLDGDVGYNIAANGTVTRIAPAAARDRRTEYYHHPLTIVRAALDPSTKLSNARSAGVENLVDVALADGVQVTLGIDATTKLPSRVTSRTDNPVLGDVVVETTFTDYRDIGGLKLPSRLTTTTDGVTTADLRVSSQALDADVGDLASPAAPAPAGAPPVNVTAEAVAPGIWLLAGQSHHSVLVEFSDHLTLIEAPQSEARTLGVIAKAREVRPGKPLTQVVMTHHHFDHSTGIRAAISEGLEVIAHTSAAAFVQDIAKRPHTIVPDALAKNPRPARVTPVGDRLVLQDGAMAMHLYPIAGSPHGDTLLMAHFPKERVLVQADVFPNTNAPAYPANLLENVRKRSLEVDRIVGIHGAIAPFSALEAAVAGTK